MIEFGHDVVMSDNLQIAISPEQRELLLRGLRFVRSSVLLRPSEPTEEDRQQRETELQAIEALARQLDASHFPAGT